MSDPKISQHKLNTNITSLFFKTTLTLAGVDEKKYIQLLEKDQYFSSLTTANQRTSQQKNENEKKKLNDQDAVI